MFGSEILDVAIGIVFVFLLVSIICSAIREGIESLLKTRAAYLERGIRELLHDHQGKDLARSFYHHPIIFSLYSHDYVPSGSTRKPGLFENGRKLPSYIPAGSFALALMDIAARGPDPEVASDSRAPLLSLASIRANIVNIHNEPVQRALLTAIDMAQGDLNRAQQNIQAWYDSGMDRVSGWYKRTTQWIIFWIGLFVAVALNINPITIADFLYRDDAAREAIVARASIASADTAFLTHTYARATEELKELRLPIGWPPKTETAPTRFDATSVANSLLGWLLTALAATFGAPFWFDLTNKMMVVRSTVKPREKSPEEASEDRQRGKHVRSPGSTSQPPLSGAAAAAAQPLEQIPGPPPLVIDDGCDVPITMNTRDEDLPEARGGVA